MKTLVIAPHPDDEILGPGGTLLRRKSEGDSIAWLIVSEMSLDDGWSNEKINSRKKEIVEINNFFKFDYLYNLGFPTTKVNTIPMSEIVQKIFNVIDLYKPDELLIPHSGDVHSDHVIVSKAAISCSKWFRSPSIKRILSYETLSETEFGLANNNKFHPNFFIDISEFLEKKIQAMEIYNSETGNFPFPRSRVSIESLARIRGSASGFKAAESFELLMQRS